MTAYLDLNEKLDETGIEYESYLQNIGMISRSEKLYVEFKMSEAERDLQNAQSQVETIAAALNSTIGQTCLLYTSENLFLVGESLGDPHHGKDDFFVCHRVVRGRRNN